MATTVKAAPQLQNNELLHERKLIIMWSVTNLLVVMNTTMFNVALPFVLQDFSLDSATASWLVSSYSIMFAISTLTYSRLTDFIPISRLLLTGLGLFGIGSISGFFSNSFMMLLASRTVQAAGAGTVMGTAMVMAGRYIPLSRRGKAMSIITSATALGFGLGPVLGGVVIQYTGWHSLFVVSGIAVLSLPLFLMWLPKEYSKKVRFDVIGALLIVLSVTSFLLFMSTFSIYILLGSAVLIGTTWVYLNKTKLPFVPPVLLKNRQYVKLVCIASFNFFINFSNLFIMPIILTTVFDKKPTEVGLIIFPGALIAMIAGQFIGRLIDRFGNVWIIFFAQVFIISAALSFAWLSTVTAYFILITYMFASIGFTTLSTSLMNEVTRILPEKQLGSGIGVIQLTQFIGGGIGVAVTGLLMTLNEAYPIAIMYRNIFCCLALLMTFGMIVYLFYRLRARVKQPS